MITIEKGIPVPKSPRERVSEITETARAMEVGDSILLPYNRSIPYTSNMHRTTGFKFMQKREGEMVRIWRIQ